MTLREALRGLEAARNHLAWADPRDPDAIDAAVYELAAAEARVRQALQEARSFAPAAGQAHTVPPYHARRGGTPSIGDRWQRRRRQQLFGALLVAAVVAYLAAGTVLLFALAYAGQAVQEPEPPRVLVVEREVYPEPGAPFPVVASWYGPGFVGRPTASGETYTGRDMTAAHREWPFGTWVELRHPVTGRTVAVRITDRGPWVEGRDIDLSQAAAEALGITEAGVVTLEARVLEWGGR